jgi:hypothetical protein
MFGILAKDGTLVKDDDRAFDAPDPYMLWDTKEQAISGLQFLEQGSEVYEGLVEVEVKIGKKIPVYRYYTSDGEIGAFLTKEERDEFKEDCENFKKDVDTLGVEEALRKRR